MRDGSWKGFAATMFEVNRLDWRPQWEREKLGGKLVMRLHKGDAVEVDDDDGVRRCQDRGSLSPSNGILYSSRTTRVVTIRNATRTRTIRFVGTSPPYPISSIVAVLR